MSVETVKMSSKGQIVIPQGIREELDAGEGSVFAVIGTKDSVILRKIGTPSKDDLLRELVAIAKEGKKRLAASGVKEKDIPTIVAKRRKT